MKAFDYDLIFIEACGHGRSRSKAKQSVRKEVNERMRFYGERGWEVFASKWTVSVHSDGYAYKAFADVELMMKTSKEATYEGDEPMKTYRINTNLGYFAFRQAEDERSAMFEIIKQLIAEGVKEASLTCENISMSYKFGPVETPKNKGGPWIPYSGPREPIIDGPSLERPKDE